LYRETLEDNVKLCLCSMIAAELHSFPQEIHDELNLFFRSNESWLEHVLEQGKAERVLQFTISTQEQARIMVAFVQGVQLLSRPFGGLAYFDTAVVNFVSNLK